MLSADNTFRQVVENEFKDTLLDQETFLEYCLTGQQQLENQ